MEEKELKKPIANLRELSYNMGVTDERNDKQTGGTKNETGTD